MSANKLNHPILPPPLFFGSCKEAGLLERTEDSAAELATDIWLELDTARLDELKGGTITNSLELELEVELLLVETELATRDDIICELELLGNEDATRLAATEELNVELTAFDELDIDVELTAFDELDIDRSELDAKDEETDEAELATKELDTDELTSPPTNEELTDDELILFMTELDEFNEELTLDDDMLVELDRFEDVLDDVGEELTEDERKEDTEELLMLDELDTLLEDKLDGATLDDAHTEELEITLEELAELAAEPLFPRA
jgi:hypothetical protein